MNFYDFLIFNNNALSNIAYLLSSNVLLVILLASFVATVFLLLREEVNNAFTEEHEII